MVHDEGALEPVWNCARYLVMPLPVPSVNPVQLNESCLLPGVTEIFPFNGLSVSNIIVSLTGAALIFPHLSRNQTLTVLSPLLLGSVQFIGDESLDQELQLLVLLMHILIVPPPASAAVSANFTKVLRVAAAPPLIVTVPIGGSVSMP